MSNEEIIKWQDILANNPKVEATLIKIQDFCLSLTNNHLRWEEGGKPFEWVSFKISFNKNTGEGELVLYKLKIAKDRNNREIPVVFGTFTIKNDGTVNNLPDGLRDALT